MWIMTQELNRYWKKLSKNSKIKNYEKNILWWVMHILSLFIHLCYVRHYIWLLKKKQNKSSSSLDLYNYMKTG